jgi:hypothetical protein
MCVEAIVSQICVVRLSQVCFFPDCVCMCVTAAACVFQRDMLLIDIGRRLNGTLARWGVT